MGMPGAADSRGVPVQDSHTSQREDGFTIVEVMVAIFILLVGVFATLALVENSLSSTRRTSAREQATNVARDAVERSRQVPYTSMTATQAPAQLQAALPDAGALSGSSFTVTRRNTVYSVTVTACSIDDPSDGAGIGDATFCAAPTGTSGPGTPASGFAASVNVLGVAVTLGGSLLQTVCNAVGTNSAILNRLTGAVSTVVPVSACPTTSQGTVAFDSRPDDLRRVRVDVTWTPRSSATQAISQTVLLTNPLPNDCPLTTPVAPATLPVGCPTPVS
jgi:Tfp pilus assembly protein PilV